jgi:hypothetical protein
MERPRESTEAEWDALLADYSGRSLSTKRITPSGERHVAAMVAPGP